MDGNEDDEMKDVRLCSGPEDEQQRDVHKPLEQGVDSDNFKDKQQNGDVSPKHLEQVSEDWSVSENDHFTDLYRCSTETELALSSPDEENKIVTAYKNKTESLAKDPLITSTRDSEKPPIKNNTSTVLDERNTQESLTITNQIENNAEVNNNVDDIQPQFKELSLHSPTSALSVIRNAKTEPLIKCFRLYVEASCILNSSSEPEILSISCEPIVESSSTPTANIPTRDSGSSGNFADVSKTISSLSGSPVTYIPPPPVHLTRMSYTSSSSSSSFPSSAAALFQKIITHPSSRISQNRINQLNRKWRNSRMVYHILDVIDRAFLEGPDVSTELPVVTEQQSQAPTTLDDLPEETTPVSTRKRHPSEDIEDPVSKRLRSSSPVASTSYEDLLGAGVFAKWQNRKYYFAHIVDILSDGRIQVVFLDTTIRAVTKDQVITELELLIGHKIMVTEDCESDEYYPGIVTAFSIDEGAYKYSVATNNGDFEVNVAQVYFTEYQAKFIKQGIHSASLATSEVGGSALYPGCSGIQKDFHETCETDSSTSKILLAELESFRHITGCDVETNDPQNLNSTVKLKNVQGKLPKRSNKNEDSLLGPLKFKGVWFKDLYFLVTCSTHVTSGTTEEVQTDSEDYPFTTVPFVYDRLVQQIKLGGGQVFDKFEDVHPTQYNETYLITNRPCLTPKYLRCLAAGITIVCHEWIVNCTIKQKRISLQELPAGWSVEKCRFVNTFERKTSQPLSGLRIKVAQLADQHFHRFWSGICSVVGGSVSKFTGNFENTDIIVAENGFKDPKLDNAAAFGIPVVSASWIIQSIIHGEVRPYDGHSSYNHLYEETEEF